MISISEFRLGNSLLAVLLLAGCTGGTNLVLPNDGEQPAGPPAENQLPVADIDSDCSELTCQFTDASTDLDGNVVGWRWDFGDRTIVTERNPSHTFAEAGSYTVILTVTDNGGASDGTSAAVTVREAPSEPARAQTTTVITSDSPDPSVAGKSIVVRFSVSSSSGTPEGDVVVTDPEGGTCTGRAPSGSCTLKPGGVGTRTITATYQGSSSFSGSSDTEQHRVTQAPPANNDRPEADFDIECVDATLICVFLDKSEDDDGNLVSWVWEFGDGDSFNGRFPPPHQYAERTEYFVVLTVTDNVGATDSRTRMVKLDD